MRPAPGRRSFGRREEARVIWGRVTIAECTALGKRYRMIFPGTSTRKAAAGRQSRVVSPSSTQDGLRMGDLAMTTTQPKLMRLRSFDSSSGGRFVAASRPGARVRGRGARPRLWPTREKRRETRNPSVRGLCACEDPSFIVGLTSRTMPTPRRLGSQLKRRQRPFLLRFPFPTRAASEGRTLTQD